MIRIGSDTDIEIVLIDLEWISIRYFRQGSEDNLFALKVHVQLLGRFRILQYLFN